MNHSVENSFCDAENIQHFFDVAVSKSYDRRNCLNDSQKVIREVKLKLQKTPMYETDLDVRGSENESVSSVLHDSASDEIRMGLHGGRLYHCSARLLA